MFSHVTVGISDIDRAVGFYRPLMEALGWEEKFATRNPPGPWAGWHQPDTPRPLFIVMRPFDNAPPEPGNGTMVAFNVTDRATVDATWELALDLGGTDEGKPALRPLYHGDFYGAYFRDPDGNKLCVVCHAPEQA